MPRIWGSGLQEIANSRVDGFRTCHRLTFPNAPRRAWGRNRVGEEPSKVRVGDKRPSKAQIAEHLSSVLCSAQTLSAQH